MRRTDVAEAIRALERATELARRATAALSGEPPAEQVIALAVALVASVKAAAPGGEPAVLADLLDLLSKLWDVAPSSVGTPS